MKKLFFVAFAIFFSTSLFAGICEDYGISAQMAVSPSITHEHWAANPYATFSNGDICHVYFDSDDLVGVSGELWVSTNYDTKWTGPGQAKFKIKMDTHNYRTYAATFGYYDVWANDSYSYERVETTTFIGWPPVLKYITTEYHGTNIYWSTSSSSGTSRTGLLYIYTWENSTYTGDRIYIHFDDGTPSGWPGATL